MAEWFEEWFDSKYYHLLYKDRDHKEAESFIEKLIDYLDLDESSTILDIACGSGRHALQFSKSGYRTVGIDLSPNSIRSAKQFESENLDFEVADMRDFKLKRSFDLVTNLFTSFGYFSDLDDNRKALEMVNHHLKDNGLFVMDFMNTERVIKNLVAESEKIVDDVRFILNRNYADGQIIKTIQFVDDKSINRIYKEQVQAIQYRDFLSLFDRVNLEVINCFGNYDLSQEYNSDSDRMIFVIKKKKA